MLYMCQNPYETQANEINNNITSMLEPKWKTYYKAKYLGKRVMIAVGIKKWGQIKFC